MDHTQLLNIIGSEIYKEPLANIRSSGRISDTSIPLHCVMLVVDFDTERMMNGILEFLGNSTGLYVKETIESLANIGAGNTVKALADILNVASSVKMDYYSIQNDRYKIVKDKGVGIPCISSWDEMHGRKWEDAQNKIFAIDNSIDEKEMYLKLEEYVKIHMDAIKMAMKSA